MKICVPRSEFDFLVFYPNRTYEFCSNHCKRLAIVVSAEFGKNSKIILSGNFDEVKIFGGDIELATKQCYCKKLNIEKSSVRVLNGICGQIDDMILQNSRFVYHLPCNKDPEKLVIKNVLKLTRSNLILNDSGLRANTVLLNDGSRLFCEATVSTIKLSISEIYEDATSYIVLPSRPEQINVEGVTL